MKLSANFDLSEFKSKDGQAPNGEVLKNLVELAKNLEVLRKYLGCPIHINSGFRSKEHNKKVGGADNSYHVKGMAADIWTKKHKPKQIAEIIEYLIEQGKMKQGGIGIYKNFIHYDTRNHMARWNG